MLVNAMVLCRLPPYQVELFSGVGPGEFPQHSHPNVDSIEVMLCGEVGFIVDGKRMITDEMLATLAPDGALALCGTLFRVRPNQLHGQPSAPPAAHFSRFSVGSTESNRHRSGLIGTGPLTRESRDDERGASEEARDRHSGGCTRVARSYVGVRYLHQGHSRHGVDCVGLIRAVSDELGILPADHWPADYGKASSPKMAQYTARYCTPAATAGDGIIALFLWKTTYPHHIGILTSTGTLIHSYSKAQKVIEHGFRGPWLKMLDSLWRLPGVDRG